MRRTESRIILKNKKIASSDFLVKFHKQESYSTPNLNMFKESVYKFAKKIPKGKVATYGQLAKLAGKPKAARAVGILMKTHPSVPSVPCHRVVGSGGDLTGYTAKGGLHTKKALLIKEGVYFKNKKVDLVRSQWWP